MPNLINVKIRGQIMKEPVLKFRFKFCYNWLFYFSENPKKVILQYREEGSSTLPPMLTTGYKEQPIGD